MQKNKADDGHQKDHHKSTHHKGKSLPAHEEPADSNSAPPVVIKPLTSDMLKKLDQIEEEAEVMPTPGRDDTQPEVKRA